MNPYFMLAGLIGIVAAIGGGFVKGEQYANAKHDQAQLHQLTQALDERDAKQKQINTLEAAAAVREQTRQTIVREITREVPTIINRPIYAQRCVDSDGVKLLDRAADAASGAGTDPAAPADPSGKPAQSPATH